MADTSAIDAIQRTKKTFMLFCVFINEILLGAFSKKT
jgi:hypothetical protein